METLQRQIGFCLICGSSVNKAHSFSKTEKEVCHDNCIEKRLAKWG